jgi:transcriptional regulator GlxA family with amidase domain
LKPTSKLGATCIGSEASPKQVAGLCGFVDADTLRRAFVRQVGVTPAEYRKQYAEIPQPP